MEISVSDINRAYKTARKLNKVFWLVSRDPTYIDARDMGTLCGTVLLPDEDGEYPFAFVLEVADDSDDATENSVHHYYFTSGGDLLFVTMGRAPMHFAPVHWYARLMATAPYQK